MKRRQQHYYVVPQHQGPTSDRPIAKAAAWSAAVGVVWAFHHFGIWALAGAAGAYLLILVVLKALIGGAR